MELRRLCTQLFELGCETNDLGLRFLINCDAMRRLTRAIATRRCELLKAAGFFEMTAAQPPEDRCFYVAGDVNRLITLRGFFNAKTGSLHRNKPKVTPLTSHTGEVLVSEEWCERAKADWPALVAEEWQNIADYVDGLTDEVMALRDPRFGIEAILDLPVPYQALIDARDEMEADRPDYLGSPEAALRHDRDHCLVSMLIAAAPRRRNVGPLLYKQDKDGRDIGHLRRNKENKQFELHIPKKELKNEFSKALPPGDMLVIVFDPNDTRLYRSIERSAVGDDSSRLLLHREAAGDHLFPGQTGGGICDPLTAQICYKFSAWYLVWTPWRPDRGFKGVVPFGLHAIRDILATTIIKSTGSFHAAASVIYDAPETVEKRYAHLNARDLSILNIANVRLSVSYRPDPLVSRLRVSADPVRFPFVRAQTSVPGPPQTTARSERIDAENSRTRSDVNH